VEGDRSDFNILTGKPTGKNSLGKLRRRWEDSIRMNFKEIVINTKKLGLMESHCECGIEPFV
jgi:hypothetical protein